MPSIPKLQVPGLTGHTRLIFLLALAAIASRSFATKTLPPPSQFAGATVAFAITGLLPEPIGFPFALLILAAIVVGGPLYLPSFGTSTTSAPATGPTVSTVTGKVVVPGQQPPINPPVTSQVGSAPPISASLGPIIP